MKDDKESKVYARQNFDLNKASSTLVAQKLDSNNLVAKPETTLKNIMHPDNLQNHTSSPSNDDVHSDEPNNSQAAQQDGTDDEPVNSSGGSVSGKKQVKKVSRMQSYQDDFSCKAATSRLNLNHSSSIQGGGNGPPTTSREDRKNEQIMKMIERQEKDRLRREQKKSGIPVSVLALHYNIY